MISAAVMLFAIIMLCVGYPRYVFMPPTERSISMLCQLGWDSARQTRKGFILVSATFCFLAALIVNVISAFSVDSGSVGNILSYVAAVLVLTGIVDWVYAGQDQSFLDVSKSSIGGAFDDERVEGYKKLVRVLPPGVMLAVFDPIVTVIFIPILDSIVYPLYTKRAGKSPSKFGKTAVGLTVATAGLFWAGIFEVIRRNAGALEDVTAAARSP
ncbi:unnamed protein product [Phytophthora lilii]|uniref:Unnamed protein product n=1 Tax=Phytophthora lilii TaxID=2077276 RepID=A0A9W6WP62_9STRA|nr:unnamed protein product [Phytophthora lilii]